jgi:hypothetical protein
MSGSRHKIPGSEELEDKYTLGDYAIWPEIIAATWGWMYVRYHYRWEGRKIASFTAVRLPACWVAFPHFTQSSCLYFTENFPDGTDPGQLKWKLRNHFLLQLSNSKFKKSYEINTELDSGFLTEKHDFNSPEIRFKSRDFEALGTFSIPNKTISFLPLQPDESAHLSTLPTSVRYKILKAERNGIHIKTGGVELLDSFYPVYRQNIQRLGSFGLPKRFFYHLLTMATERSSVFIASKEKKILGGSILISLDNHAENPWFASSPEGNTKYATYALHYAMQKMTITKGLLLYSFGSSTKGSGVEYYKQQWGTFEKPFYLNSSHPLQDVGRIHRLLKPILKRIPYQLAMLLDNRISFRIY